MKGHIRKRGKNSWAVAIYVGRNEQGKPRYKWHTVTGGRRQAEDECARLLNQMTSGRQTQIGDQLRVCKVRFHDLRHSHATQLLREGIHPKVVSERLGHSAVGITLDTYRHVTPSMQEEAAKRIDVCPTVGTQKTEAGVTAQVRRGVRPPARSGGVQSMKLVQNPALNCRHQVVIFP